MKLKAAGIILGLVGQAIILAIWLCLFDATYFDYDEGIRWLDFGVISFIYWIWIANMLIKPIKLSDPAQKSVGGLGIRWFATVAYTIAALGYMFICESSPFLASFGWQLAFQGIFLFIFLILIFSSATASQKTGQIYVKEQIKKEGKKSIKASIQALLFKAEDSNVPANVTSRIRDLMSETRYISPSTDPAARDLDDKIARTCQSIEIGMSDFAMNEQSITQNLYQLETDLKRRKSL